MFARVRVSALRTLLAIKLPVEKVRVYYGWRIVVCGFLGHAVRQGLAIQAFGFFLTRMERELVWTRSALTFGLTLRSLLVALMLPQIGRIIDRAGPRWPVTTSALTVGQSFLLTTYATSIWTNLFAFGVLGSLAIVGFGPTVSGSIVSKGFVARRGLAMGLTDGGINVGTLLAIPFIVWLIASTRWG
jgi:MFS family permease